MDLHCSSSTSCSNYDVFLSFRGPDTRKKFTDHLYAALKRAGFRTFRDDDELERGESIGPELLKAIEGSKFSIIVFSRNYALSRWCLDELVHIIRCKKERGQTVLPVFYDVEPTIVRNQTESFGEAFSKHEERFGEDKLVKWRNALREAADLKGMVVPNHADGHESVTIVDIVKFISVKFNPKKLFVAMNSVGLHSRVNEVISLLDVNLVDICIVGICGMGGIGKTTIAKEVYNLIFQKFEASCFLANVRQKSVTNDTVHLQNQLMSESFKEKYEEIYNVDRGLKVIEERLRNIRVLIVLDDVNNIKQLNDILGNCDWLAGGSRIIITTRTKDLVPSSLYRQYEVEKLNPEESLRLLSINAFGKYPPIEEYKELANSVTHYCGGIPLALEVLGSSLRGEGVNIWESRLKKLKVIADGTIQKILEISYESLDDTEKFLFLDIACFFVGNDLDYDKDYIISILDDCGFFSIDGINTLIKRCLVNVTSSNELAMHDLLQDMGREIVRQECPMDPGKRSRVWREEEAFDLLEDEMGTEAVEGLNLCDLYYTRETVCSSSFRKMKRLRLLRLDNVILTGSYEHISKKLRWLRWRGFPLESLPPDLHMRNLVALDMRFSRLEVWGQMKNLPKLKFLNLSRCYSLKETPDFKGLPGLEIIEFEYCRSLVNVHESIGLLTKLVKLNLRKCANLFKSCRNRDVLYCYQRLLPVCLRQLDLRSCGFWDDTVLESILPNLPLLEDLKLCVNMFSRLPASISILPKLSLLWLNYCEGLGSIPQLSSSLRTLRARGCNQMGRICLTNCHMVAYFSGPKKVGSTTLNVELPFEQLELEGSFTVEPIGVGIGKRVLELDKHPEKVFRVPDIYIRLVNNSTETARISPLEGLLEKGGIYNIFLPGSEISSWYNHQSKSNSVSFDVPPLQGCTVLGAIICAVYSREICSGETCSIHPWEICSSETCAIYPWIRITTKTKLFLEKVYKPSVSLFCNEGREDTMWVTYCSFEDWTQENRSFETTMRCEIEEGDQVEVLIGTGRGLPVEKCGVRLVYHQNDQAARSSTENSREKEKKPEPVVLLLDLIEDYHQRKKERELD